MLPKTKSNSLAPTITLCLLSRHAPKNKKQFLSTYYYPLPFVKAGSSKQITVSKHLLLPFAFCQGMLPPPQKKTVRKSTRVQFQSEFRAVFKADLILSNVYNIYLFNVLFLSRWKPFDGTEGHKHPEYKRIEQLKKSFENQKELENHLKTCPTLKNPKKPRENQKKTKKPRENQKNNKTKKTILRESRIYVFLFFLFYFFCFLEVFLFFFNFSSFFVFLCCGCKWLFAAPPSFFK